MAGCSAEWHIAATVSSCTGRGYLPRMSAEADTVQCKFPGCDKQAEIVVMPEGDEGLALCSEHRDLLIDDAEEFRRLWGALDPRPPDRPAEYQPRRLDDS